MNANEVYSEYREQIAHQNKATIRRRFADLYISRDYLRAIRARVEAVGHTEVANSLHQGAWRRINLHDDYGSADQMLFVEAVLDCFGIAGLRF